MGIKSFRPITHSLRYKTVLDYKEELTAEAPYKPLTEAKNRIDGRNNYGQIAVRHRGGGNKKRYRIIDFKRDKVGIPAKVATIEYDPNRSAFIALLSYADGEHRYILQPIGLKVGMSVVSGNDADILVGNALPLKHIPLGTTIHNIELRPGKGAQMARSAGAAAQLVAKEAGFAHVKLPSGEVRLVNLNSDDRTGWQSRSRKGDVRKGRTHPASGCAADGSRRCYESCRSPAWWRRRPRQGVPPDDTVGQADAWL
jgi:large subunit ribosomal protein L2